MYLEFLNAVHTFQRAETLEGYFGGARYKLEEEGTFCLREGPKGPPEPLSLKRGGSVLVILSVTLQIVYVNGGQARYEQFQLGVTEDGDEVFGDDIVETLKECPDL